jgi:hypothetical protein
MCNNPKNIKLGCYGCACCLWVMSAVVIYGVFIIPYSNYNDYNLHKCNITRVEYPTELPVNNDFHNNRNWKSCDCGDSCKSWTACIKLYSSVDETQLIKNRYYIDRDDECTFNEAKCTNGFQRVHNSLTDSYNIYIKYINTTIDCYYDDPMTDIYIIMDKMLDNLYFPLGLLIVFTIIIIVMIIADCSHKSDVLVEYEVDYRFASFHDIIPEQIEVTSFTGDIPPPFNDETPPKFTTENVIDDPPVYSE